MGAYADSRTGNRLSDLSDNELPGCFVFGASCTASVGSGYQLCGLHCNSGGNMEGAGTTGNRGGTDQRGGIEGGSINKWKGILMPLPFFEELFLYRIVSALFVHIHK